MTQIIEIYGDNYVGKTSYALSLVNNKTALFIDADNKLNNDIVKKYSNMYISYINNVKDIYYIVENIVKYVDLIIIDSLPNLTYDNDINNLTYDFRLFKVIKDIITKLCKPNNCDLIIVNQNRQKEDKKQSFGIRALGPYYTKRIYVNKDKIKITKDLS